MTMDQKIEQCQKIDWYSLTSDQLDRILEIARVPKRTQRRYVDPFVQSPNCIGGCQSLYAGMCGPCYRLNRMKPVARVSDFMAHKRKKDDL